MMETTTRDALPMDRFLDELVAPFAFGGAWGDMDRHMLVGCGAPAWTLARFESLWEAVWNNAWAPVPAKSRPEVSPPIPKAVVDEATTLYSVVGSALRSMGAREGEELDGVMMDAVRKLAWFFYRQGRQDTLTTAR
jgi:hypothetical protein